MKAVVRNTNGPPPGRRHAPSYPIRAFAASIQLAILVLLGMGLYYVGRTVGAPEIISTLLPVLVLNISVVLPFGSHLDLLGPTRSVGVLTRTAWLSAGVLASLAVLLLSGASTSSVLRQLGVLASPGNASIPWPATGPTVAPVAAGPVQGRSGPGGRTRIVLRLGSTNTSYHAVATEVYAQLLVSYGYGIERLADSSSVDQLRAEAKKGSVDVYVDYVASMLAGSTTAQNKQPSLATALRLLPERQPDLIPLVPAAARVGLGFAVYLPGREDIQTLTQFVAIQRDMVIGEVPACNATTACVSNLEAMYGASVRRVKELKDEADAVEQLQQHQIDTAVVSVMDPHLILGGLTVLEDDRKTLLPADNVVPVVRRPKLINDGATARELMDVTDKVAMELTTRELASLSREAVIEHRDLTQIATSWLNSRGVLGTQ